ncbi:MULTISPECIES: extracellular solute-binding protein [Rhizobium]|uniref:Extracellular solute-binding protein n=1 Tax=Rhizobium rhododendri TaxID=2506430 RepID=A0ABY8IP55_9HYPH|nr:MULTISPECIES: extracellular solute-binding protein [Rhizobium]TQX86737.1 extracellular solute-binding protein [Rhizobium sp. rho-13.1]TQY11347.1 extracellular solute-binding protein [Rhizobium sp. rho-1.1]WFS24933.1 extracellular solute-binding protein [Rhizobium rhododendri]
MNIGRREFLTATTAFGVGIMAGGIRIASAAPGVLDIFFNSDTNVIDFWTQVVKPGFEAANSGVTLNLVAGGGGSAMNTLADRAMAAFQANKDPQVDMLEAVTPFYPTDSIKAGLWVDFSKANLRNYAKVDPVVLQDATLLPYRGSQVVLMYNGDKVAKAPQTFPELVAWIKANPGQFAYARPDLGDSGACFIERALQEVTGKKPELFQPENYSADTATPIFEKVWPLLKDIAPSLYNGGEYTSGNTASIQLLASSAVTMTVAWSDMALQAMSQGVVPPTTAIAQLQDLAFTGGFSGIVVPSVAANKGAALKLADYLISPEVQNQVVTALGGFPGIKWEFMAAELQAKFAKVAPRSIPVFPATWEPALFEAWYRNVASTIQR